jgi:pimeloyl-ACP methyl ester carboxylesterase
MRLIPALVVALALTVPAAGFAQPFAPAVVADPPRDAAHPAGMITFGLPTQGVRINAMLLTAAGAGAHPTVLLLHGLPGNEQNLDLARALQRAGWNVLTLHYRGSWGSPGTYSFAHCLEDAQAALAWLRAPTGEAAAHIDPGRIALVGHSLGGFVAGYTDGHDPDVMGAVLISAARIGGGFGGAPRSVVVKIIEDNIQNADMHTLGDATAEGLADEAIASGKAWDLPQFAPQMARKPLLMITSDDGLAPADEALANAVAAQPGAAVTVRHFATDHSYNDQRLALQDAVIRWLAKLPGAPAM